MIRYGGQLRFGPSSFGGGDGAAWLQHYFFLGYSRRMIQHSIFHRFLVLVSNSPLPHKPMSLDVDWLAAHVSRSVAVSALDSDALRSSHQNLDEL